jgi:hypothetical protein
MSYDMVIVTPKKGNPIHWVNLSGMEEIRDRMFPEARRLGLWKRFTTPASRKCLQTNDKTGEFFLGDNTEGPTSLRSVFFCNDGLVVTPEECEMLLKCVTHPDLKDFRRFLKRAARQGGFFVA